MRPVRRSGRRTVAVLTVTMLAGAVAAMPAWGSGVPPWRITKVLGSSVDAVAATGPRDAWAGSDASVLVEHWNGKAWTTLRPPSGLGGLAPGNGTNAVAASSVANVWVFAGSNKGAVDYTVAQHWTGKGWAKPVALQAWAGVNTAVTSGPRDAWAFGVDIGSGTSGYAAHYNGAKWTRVSFPLDVQPGGASELSAGNIWAVGSWDTLKAEEASPFAVEHWTGGAWHKVPVPRLRLPVGEAVQGSSVVADGPDNVWAVGVLSANRGVAPGIVLLHWNGKAFTRVNVPYPVTGPYTLAGDGAGGFWLNGTQYTKTSFAFYLYHYNGGHWTRVPVPNAPKDRSQVNAMAWIPGTRSVWATGLEYPISGSSGNTQGIILKYGP